MILHLDVRLQQIVEPVKEEEVGFSTCALVVGKRGGALERRQKVKGNKPGEGRGVVKKSSEKVGSEY